jgi:hypothetical protein
MEKHNVIKLEAKIKELIGALAQLSGQALAAAQTVPSDLQELLTIIHRPGWTSVAEGILVEGVVDSMLLQTRTLSSLKQVLLTGSRAVGSAK